MQYKKLGNSGIEASVIALGTWVMGGWMWGGTDENESISAIHASIDAGVNLIDTAPVYGFGVSEEVVGKAIKGKRDKVLVATKCGLRWDLNRGNLFFYASDEGITKENQSRPVFKYLGKESIIVEVERSLQRLQTDYIDLYQTHWQDSTTPIEETMEALTKLKKEGKIRAIGVSNATVDHMKEYGVLDSDQEKYSMFARAIDETGVVDYCTENNIAILAYSPMANGLLTGKISPDRKYNPGDLRISNPLFSAENINKVNGMLNEFKPIADKYGVSAGQLILGWTFHRRGITHLLCGARNRVQALDNAKAGDLILETNDITLINQIYERYFS